MGNVYFKSDLNYWLRLSVCTLRANHKKISSGTEYMRTEHKTLPSDPGTVGETLVAIGFSAT